LALNREGIMFQVLKLNLFEVKSAMLAICLPAYHALRL